MSVRRCRGASLVHGSSHRSVSHRADRRGRICQPTGRVLEQMIGATAAALTAWQQAIVAAVLVGVMLILELLRQQPRSPQEKPAKRPIQKPSVEGVGSAELHDPNSAQPTERSGNRKRRINKPAARNIGS